MAKPRMDLSAFVGKLLEEQDGDVLREGIRVLSQALMETEVAGLIGAERHERTGERTAYRNGTRTRTWDTRMGTIELAIPKVRPGTYFPSLLQPRRRAEHALLAVGSSTRSWRRFGRGRSRASIAISGWTRRTTRCAWMAG
jgi:transposase-like protein